jgi:CubicO group peptidase (beta-lactamase class C family)
MSRHFSDVITANGLLPVMHPPTWNSTPVRSACLPAANAITDARSLAALYGAVVNPESSGLISRSTLNDFVAEKSAGTDRVTGFQSRFGVGFMLPTVGNPMYSDASFGHEGVGGAQAFGDIDERIGIGYVPNRLLEIAGGDPRVAALVVALREARRRTAPGRSQDNAAESH